MKEPTPKQKKVLDFVQSRQLKGATPSMREIAAHFGYTLTAAADHLRALKRKGIVKWEPRQARSIQIVSPFEKFKSATIQVPIYGGISAGYGQERAQDPKGCITIDVQSLGIRATARTFALEVRGDSMIGRHIVPGDFVILEHGKTPKPGDVVAALIDNESLLKTFVVERGKPCLKAENPKYPKIVPAGDLVIQGVMVGLFRKAVNSKG
jgi:repressor LexA